MTEELKVTSPEEYAEKARQASAEDNAGFLHRLKKTGAVVRLRHVDMEALAMVGSLPMSLVTAATEGAGGQSEVKRKRNPTPEEIEAGSKNLIFMRQMVVENCLEPSVRNVEGVGVFFINAKGEQVARVDKDDFVEMFEVITGEAGADGLDSFRNRKERRASAAKSRRQTLQSKTVESPEGQPAIT